MKGFIAELFKAPDGVKADEIAVLAVVVGILFVLTLTIFLGLELYDVTSLGHRWVPLDFSNAAAVLFGAAGSVLAAITLAMGVKAKFGG
jgi:prepilin signal peptidase PulO-like enzyme (type II secretory pathway)